MGHTPQVGAAVCCPSRSVWQNPGLRLRAASQPPHEPFLEAPCLPHLTLPLPQTRSSPSPAARQTRCTGTCPRPPSSPPACASPSPWPTTSAPAEPSRCLPAGGTRGVGMSAAFEGAQLPPQTKVPYFTGAVGAGGCSPGAVPPPPPPPPCGRQYDNITPGQAPPGSLGCRSRGASYQTAGGLSQLPPPHQVRQLCL